MEVRRLKISDQQTSTSAFLTMKMFYTSIYIQLFKVHLLILSQIKSYNKHREVFICAEFCRFILSFKISVHKHMQKKKKTKFPLPVPSSIPSPRSSPGHSLRCVPLCPLHTVACMGTSVPQPISRVVLSVRSAASCPSLAQVSLRTCPAWHM